MINFILHIYLMVASQYMFMIQLNLELLKYLYDNLFFFKLNKLCRVDLHLIRPHYKNTYFAPVKKKHVKKSIYYYISIEILTISHS
jgi:hypothetical protein